MKYKEGPGSWINVNLIKRLLHFMLIKCKFYHHSLIHMGLEYLIFSFNDLIKYSAMDNLLFYQKGTNIYLSVVFYAVQFRFVLKRLDQTNLVMCSGDITFSRLDKRLWIWWSSPSARAGTRERRGRRWSWRSTRPAAAAASQARRRPASPSQCLTPPPVSASAPSSSGARSVRHVWRDQVSGGLVDMYVTCWCGHLTLFISLGRPNKTSNYYRLLLGRENLFVPKQTQG